MIEPQAIAGYLSKRIRTLFRNRYRRLKRHNVYLDGLCLTPRPRIGKDPLHLNLFDRPKRDNEPSDALFHFWYRGPDGGTCSGSVILAGHELVVYANAATHHVDLSDPDCFEQVIEIFNGYFTRPA